MAFIHHDNCSSIDNWTPNSASEVLSGSGSIHFHKIDLSGVAPGGSFAMFPGKTYAIKTDHDFYAKYEMHFAIPSPGRIEDLDFSITFAQLAGTGSIHLVLLAKRTSTPGDYTGKVQINSFGTIISGGYTIDLTIPAIFELQSRISGSNKYIDLTYNGSLKQSYNANTVENILLQVPVVADQSDNTGDIVYYIDDVYFEWSPIPATLVELSEHNITLVKYQSQNLDVTIEPTGYFGTTEIISSNSDVATGLVYAAGVGEADITFQVTTIDPDTGDDVILSDVCHVTVLTNILPTPAKPTWNSTTLHWEQVTNASGYTIKLYVQSDQYTGLETTIYSIPAGSSSYDASEEVANIYTSGLTNVYVTATIIAEGDYDPYYPSDESIASDVCIPPILDTPNKPNWVNTKIVWNIISHASSYTANLYAESDEYTGYLYNISGISANYYDLSSDIDSLFASLTNLLLTAKVIAIGDYDPYYTSNASESSDSYVPPTLDQVTQPAWVNKVITWKDVANATAYKVRLYNASAEVLDTQIVASGVQRYDFTDEIENYLPAGTYTATVQALAEGV